MKVSIRCDHWLTVFYASRIYGAEYEDPPEQKIEWPTGTFLQRRMAELKAKEKNHDIG